MSAKGGGEDDGFFYIISDAHASRPSPPLTRRSASTSILLTLLLFLPFLQACTQQEVFFCPQDACGDKLIDEFKAATDRIHIAIYFFSHDAIADAVIEAHKRGVEVMVVAEADENRPDGGNYNVVARLTREGIPYRDDSNSALLHDKFAVIDDHTVLTGSFNYTLRADQQNNENLVLLSSERMVAAYEAEFQKLWDNGVE